MILGETRGKSGWLGQLVVLLLVWVVAGVTNSGGFIMGNAPTTFGTVTTLIVVLAWLLAGWLAGVGSKTGFVRFAAVFWVAMVVGGPLVFWALTAAPGMTILQGGWVLPLLLFVVAAPLYGLVALLPYQAAVVWTAGMGVAVLAMTLGSYSPGRRVVRRSPAAKQTHPADAQAVD